MYTWPYHFFQCWGWVSFNFHRNEKCDQPTLPPLSFLSAVPVSGWHTSSYRKSPPHAFNWVSLSGEKIQKHPEPMHALARCSSLSIFIPTGSMVLLYMVTFIINIPPMLAYIPYMDPMGYSMFFSGSGHPQNKHVRRGLMLLKVFTIQVGKPQSQWGYRSSPLYLMWTPNKFPLNHLKPMHWIEPVPQCLILIS